MTDPERLVEGDDLGAELLRSARTLDARRARERKAALIGAAAGASAIAATKAASAGSVLSTKGALQGVFAKWLALVIGAAAIGIGIGLGVTGSGGEVPVGASRFAPALRELRAPVVAEAPAEKPPEASALVEAPKAAPSPAPPETTPVPRGKRASKAPPASASADGAARLAEELLALRVAREALASGDGPRALRALDDYAARFPRGHLALEAEVLRIEALSRSGDASAAARARRFLETHPQTPYAERLRAVAGGPSIP